MTRNKRQRVEDSDTETSRPLTFEEKFETDKNSNEEILGMSFIIFSFFSNFNASPALQKKGWSSKVYKHFRDPQIKVSGDGKVKYVFICKTWVVWSFTHFFPRCSDVLNPSNPSQSCTRARTDTGTTNLLRHVEACTGKKAPDDQTIEKFAQGSTYTTGAFRFLITRWVTECHRPFKIVEDPPFQDMLRMLYSRVDIPSDTTVSRDVREVYRISQLQVAKTLQVGILNFCLWGCYLQLRRHTPGVFTSDLMGGLHLMSSHFSASSFIMLMKENSGLLLSTLWRKFRFWIKNFSST